MNRSEFVEMHESCVTAMRVYFAQAEKMSAMLAECTSEPMSFGERFSMMFQSVAEHDAHLTYLGAKSLLLNAARMGYGVLN